MALEVRKRRMMLVAALAAGIAAPASTQQRAPLPPALTKLDAGLWELRDVDRPTRRMAPVCLGHPIRLMRIEHPSGRCSPLIVAKDANSVTVHYTCGGGDYGQTVLRAETPRLAQIETQGIRGGRPFSYRAEGRWLGRCNAE